MITTDLPFGKVGSERFAQLLADSTSYLEYGSGSSTLMAATLVPSLVSVESDPKFLAAVEGLCGPPAAHEERRFIHAEIGTTGAWGTPLLRRPTRLRVAKWIAYPMAPWISVGREYRTETVLVDGRFRVASALAVVLMQPDTQWAILFDDYEDRPEYWGFETFADLAALHGRMAEFRPRTGVSMAEARLAFEYYRRDWR